MLTWVGAPVAVYGTVLIIMFAFIGRFTAYSVRSISSSLVQLHPELEESARVAGYGWLRTFCRITFPLILPSILAGWLLLFSFFMTELSMVILLYSASNRIFSILSFEVWNVGDFSRSRRALAAADIDRPRARDPAQGDLPKPERGHLTDP